jgi:hypothetical protein
MQYEEYYPQGPLKQFINKFWFVKADAGHSLEKILPLPAIHCIFNLGEGYKLYLDETMKTFKECNGVFISDLKNKHQVTQPKGVSHNAGVEFKPLGLKAFTTCSPEVYTDTVVDADVIFDSSILELCNLILELEPKFIFMRLENYFNSKLIVESN